MRAFVFLMCLVGCGGEAVLSIPCDRNAIDELYKVSYQELAGTCGPFDTQTVDFSSNWSDHPCKVYDVVEYDLGCSLNIKLECELEDGVVVKTSLHYGFGIDDEGHTVPLEGTASNEIITDDGSCESNYLLKYKVYND